MASPYNWHWRTVTRPRILERDRYCCLRCHQRFHASKLEVAHLVIPPTQPGHDDDDNLATMCQPCHKAFDYLEWARKCHETRCARKDPARPLLRALLESLRRGAGYTAAP